MGSRIWTPSAAASWATASSWYDLTVPVSTDDANLLNSTYDVTGGYNQAAVTLANLNIALTYSGKVGLAPQTTFAISGITRSSSTATATTSLAHGYVTGDVVDISGTTETEYNGTFTITVGSSTTFTYTVTGTPSTPASGSPIVRKSDYLHIGATAWRVGDPSGSTTAASGSSRLNFDFGATQFTGTVLNTSGSSADTGLEPLRILGSHASNKLYVQGGRVGVATTHPSETATLAQCDVTGILAVANLGPGVTWTTIYQSAGALTTRSGGTTLTQSGGTLYTYGSSAITTVSIGGTAYLNHRTATGITTLTVLSGATADFSQDSRPMTVTTLNRYKGSTIKVNPANPSHITFTTINDIGGGTITSS